ncbi:hypothetical protein U9M48_030513 [Paspalum notatum var. saurae]|uniref:Transposase n=1 Tax=Paspalum notatum var. saurae TaxID=547442 RepID=A0AAQ3U0F3_PASNO
MLEHHTTHCRISWWLDTAKKHKKPLGFISCPCIDCKNEKEYSSSKALHDHLMRRGFMPGYVCWTKHGELGVLQGEDDDEEEGNIDFTQFNSFADTLMGDADDEDTTDALAQMLHDAKEEAGTILLYPDCKEGHKKLRSTLELLQWKASNGVFDKGFNELLVLIKKLLLEGNKLPASTYEAKEVICPLGLEVRKIHACPNDCILYRGDYRELESCPVCKASWYKFKRDDHGDVEGNLQGREFLLRNKKHAKIIRWHKEERKQDDTLRHPIDGSQWRKIDRTYPDFTEDARNIRFGLSTDGMNPFNEMSNSHSTWSVTICMYNLPPWLCVKRKFIMMPALIQGPKQPDNDIDVYLQPLFEELQLLWTEGVRMCDAHKQEAFDLRALLFGFKACVHCLDETDSTYLKHCRKVVYVGCHRRFLGGKHPVRKKGKHFNGKKENRVKPIHRSGKVVFEMVKSLRVIFGKGPGSVTVSDENGKAPMWKKKSIFWELPYWEVLDVRHAIDVMHVTKNLCVNLLVFLGMYGKNKDTLEAREDMAALKGEQGHHYLGTVSYTLSKREKESMFDCLDSIKVPFGYSSNVRRIIKCNDKKLVNLKSQDCHVLMTQLLPVVLRGILPENVRKTITKLCAFLNAISQKRYMAGLKKYVCNRSRPEGCIAKGYGTEEVIELCTDYIDELKPIGVSLSRYEGRLAALEHSTLVGPYKEDHKKILHSEYQGKSEAWITRRHIETFGVWLRQHLMCNEEINDQLAWLARGPSSSIPTFEGYEINGNTFYTRSQDQKSTNQNMGFG